MNMTWTLSDDRKTLTVTLATEPPRILTFERDDVPALLFFFQRAALAWMRGA